MAAKLLFVVSLSVLTFFYGASAVYYRLFPYQVLREAKAAFDAWLEVQQQDLIYGYVDPDALPQPQVIDSNPGAQHDGYILVTGYPYALQSACPTFGCLAWIMNCDGEVLHSWEVDGNDLWSDLAGHAGARSRAVFEPIGLHLFPNGDLLATFQSSELFPYGVGMAKFDKDSKLLWKKESFSHHWFSVSPDGLIYTPANEIIDTPFQIGDTGEVLDCEQRRINADVVLIIDENGQEIERIRLLERLIEDGFAGVVLDAPDCDPVHLNYVEYVTEEGRSRFPGSIPAT